MKILILVMAGLKGIGTKEKEWREKEQSYWKRQQGQRKGCRKKEKICRKIWEKN